MDKIEKSLLKELSRFKEIGYNIDNLEEQMVGGVSNLGMGSHVERLAKRFNIELGEQEEVEDVPAEEDTEEIVLDPEAEAEEIDVDTEAEVTGDEGMEGVEGATEDVLDVEGTTDIDAGGEDTTELDVTDLVTKQDEVNTELADQKDILAKNTESLDDLMSKLSDLETHLTSMDDMVDKISNLEDKLEEYRPRTQQEKIQLRKHDSGPYNKTLSDFFTDKEEIFDKTGKKQYILTPEEVEDYNEGDIQKSFDLDGEEEE
jgi:hypothetical protein